MGSKDWHEVEQRKLEELQGRLDPREWKWLQRSVELDCPDLETISTDEVRRIFAAPTEANPGNLNDNQLIRTLLWQLWLKLLAEIWPPIQGNIRSIWYQAVEPFYHRHGLLSLRRQGKSIELGPSTPFLEAVRWHWVPSRARSAADAVVASMTELLIDFFFHRVWRLDQVFDFEEPNDNRRSIGRNRSSIFFFTEKEGLWWLCRQLYGEPGQSITVMASNGQPSLLTLLFFTRLLGRRNRSLVIGCFCDYDPWGYSIAQNVMDKLSFLGFNVTVYYLTSWRLFSPEQISHGRDFNQATGNLQTLVKHWVEATGGVDGKPIGLHVDVLSAGQKKLVAERFTRLALEGKLAKLDQEFARVKPIPEEERSWIVPWSLDELVPKHSQKPSRK